jgi:enamine deaminase RidA (YjgF/YER057c/UK114 family)
MNASNKTKTQLLSPPALARPRGYSHIAVVPSGTFVYISGQVAQDSAGGLVGKGDFRAQVEQVFRNLKAALDASGASFHDVFKMNSYFVDLSNLAAYREVRDEYIDVNNPPASTALQVSRLVNPDWLVEIEAIAILR